MDGQVERISIRGLLREIPVQGLEEGKQFAFLMDPGIAVNIEADAGRLTSIFATLSPGTQIHLVKRILEKLSGNGDSTILDDDVFSGETVYVTRLSGDEHNIRLRVSY